VAKITFFKNEKNKNKNKKNEHKKKEKKRRLRPTFFCITSKASCPIK
jgi:hypothetical protein